MFKLNDFRSLWVTGSLLLTVPMAFAATVPPAALTGALHWRSLGPYRGGIVETVAGIASEPNHYYMGAGGGGVWESEDYGSNWKNISDKYFKNNNIGAIAVAPSNPKIIYVGTGNPAFRNTFLTGDGMHKSTDGGKTWTHIGLEKTGIISWIIVDPNDANVVYAAALGQGWASNPDRGVFKSTDGGQTWKKILYVDDKTGANTLAMAPSNPQVLYASMWQAYRTHWMLSSGGPGSGLYKSTDGGAKWTNITHNRGLPPGISGNVTVAVAPSDPNVVYTLMQVKYRGEIGGLFRSADGGKSWTLMNNSPAITQRAMYYMKLYVDPKDPNTIYIPNTSIQMSHDGGKTLSEIQPPHGDNHAFWINPNNPKLFIEGNDGGATVTRDGGKTWSSELNQPTGQYYHANLDEQFPFNIYASQQDDGSYFGPSAVAAGRLPPVWPRVEGGEEGWVVPTPGRPWITYADAYYSDEFRDDQRTGLITNVSPWPEFKFGLAGTEIKYRYGWWHRPAVFAPHNPNELLVGGNVVFESLDPGVLPWKVISPDLTRNDKSKQLRSGGPISADMTGEEMFDSLSTIAFSPLSDNIIWTGSDDGLVYVTTDGGGHWSQVRPPSLGTWSTITCIDPSDTDAGTAYMAASRYEWNDFHPYVYKTTDYGKHWTQITTGLPDDQYVESVRQDPGNPNLLFVGTSATVFMSLDGGGQWLPLGLNLPPVRVTDIAIQAAQHAVVLSTFGRAFWSLDDLQFLEQLSSAQVADDAPYLFKPQQTWLVKRSTFDFGEGGGAGAGGANLPAGATVFFHLPADYAGQPVKLSFTDAEGKLIRSITLPQKSNEARPGARRRAAKPEKLHRGMNSFMWDFRYPTAVEAKGAYHAGRGVMPPIGPEVVPGMYYAVLTYGGTTQKQPFEIKLDPNLNTTQAALQQRFDLLMSIQGAMNRLDIALNQATDARARIEKAVADKQVSARKAQKVLADLNRDIDAVIDFTIQSSRGFDVFPPRLREWLTGIYSRVDYAYVQPTPEMMQVANGYIEDEHRGVARLQTDVARANAVLKH
ncbi:MAG: glycosyl hydrolase [Gammaproteobacteria bacterium]|nr:glycosyl hydrolase [Gammaproteobacteria bacterium]